MTPLTDLIYTAATHQIAGGADCLFIIDSWAWVCGAQDYWAQSGQYIATLLQRIQTYHTTKYRIRLRMFVSHHRVIVSEVR